MRNVFINGVACLVAVLAGCTEKESAPTAVQPREAAASPWKLTPIYGGGTFTGATFLENHPDTLFCWIDMAGPYRSDDRGATWRNCFAGLSPEHEMRYFQRVRTVSPDPRDPDTLVVSGGEPWGEAGGVLITHDCGRTWRRTLVAHSYGDGGRKRDGQVIARDPRDPDRLVFGDDWDGVWLSTDGGETWTSRGLDRHWFCDIRFDLAVPGRVYACAPAMGKCLDDPKPGTTRYNQLPYERDHGLYRSDDGGATWTRLSPDAPSQIFQMKDDQRIVGLFEEKFPRVSTDGGATWTDFGEGLPPFAVYKTDYEWTPYLHDGHYYAAAGGRDVWYLISTGGSVYRRGRNEGSWTAVPHESALQSDPTTSPTLVKHRRLRMATFVLVDPRNDEHLLAGDWYNLWESTDGGRNWLSRHRGIQPICSFTVACDPFDEKGILYGAADMGLFASSDGGASWQALEEVIGAASSIAYSTKTRGLVFVVGGRESEMRIRRSRDGGRTWEKPGQKGLPELKAGVHAVFNIAEDPSTGDFYATVSGDDVRAGGAGIYRTSDAGETWTWVGAGMGDKQMFQDHRFQYFHNQLVFSPDGSGLFVSRKGIPYRFNRAKAAWDAIPSLHLRTSDPCDRVASEPYAAADPFVPGRFLIPARGNEPGLFETRDGGRTFTRLGSISGFVYDLVFDRKIPGRLYAAQREAILVSDDGGRHFAVLKDGLDLPSGTDRRLDADRGRLFFHAYGAGLWMRTVSAAADSPTAVAYKAAFTDKGYEDRLVMVREDLTDDASLMRALNIVNTAAAGGFTGVILDAGIHGEGFDFHRFTPDRVGRARKIQTRCSACGLELCPLIWSVGRAHALVDYDPSLAEGLPIRNVPYVARGGKAVFAPGKDAIVGDCGFGETNKTIAANPATGRITNAERSIERFMKLKPRRLYRCTAKAKVKGIRGDGNRVLYVGYDLHVESVRKPTRPDVKTPNRAERETAIMLKCDSDWMDVCLDFVTVETGETYVIFMMDYASQAGTIWVKDVQLRELGLQKLVVRPGAPVVVRDARTGRVYRPGKDYVEPKCWVSDHAKVPHDRPTDPDVELVLPPGSAIKEGTKLLVDAYVMARRSNEQIGACMSNPALYDYFEKSADAAVKVFGPAKHWYLQMDEIRAGNTCLDCEKRGEANMGKIYVDCLRRQLEIIRKRVPDAEVLFWPDMVDPAFSAADWRKGRDYFLCNGDFWNSRKLVPKDLVPCPWYGLEATKASMDAYAKEGVRTIYATYYDVGSLDCDRGKGSIELINTVPGCRGFIYTTFARKYGLLYDFGRMAAELSKPLPLGAQPLPLPKRTAK